MSKKLYWIEKIKKVCSDFIIDTSKPEFKDCPETANGEILLYRVYDQNGNFMGIVTSTPEHFYNLFKDIFEDDTIPEGQKLDKMLERTETGWTTFLKKLKDKGKTL